MLDNLIPVKERVKKILESKLSRDFFCKCAFFVVPLHAFQMKNALLIYD